jgi:hypothetical protein
MSCKSKAWPVQLVSHGVSNVSNETIEEFARLLVRHVRDATIQSCDTLLKPDCRSRTAERWRSTISDGDVHGSLNVIISDCVDETVFALLYAIDQGLLHLSFMSTHGKTVDLCEEGHSELAGWYIGSEGWRAMYSDERFYNY